MSVQITDTNLGIEVKNANVKIGYFTINRTGFFADTGLPKFSANLYLEYSAQDGEIYFRKCISIDDLGLDEGNFETLYSKMKNLEEFKNAKDKIPVYVAPVKIEVAPIQEIAPIEEVVPTIETVEETIEPIDETPTEPTV